MVADHWWYDLLQPLLVPLNLKCFPLLLGCSTDYCRVDLPLFLVLTSAFDTSSCEAASKIRAPSCKADGGKNWNPSQFWVTEFRAHPAEFKSSVLLLHRSWKACWWKCSWMRSGVCSAPIENEAIASLRKFCLGQLAHKICRRPVWGLHWSIISAC